MKNKAKVFDIHSHVHFAGFDENRDEVIRRMVDEGIGTISVGTQRDTSEQAIALAHKINNDPFSGEAYATVDLHPIHTDASLAPTQTVRACTRRSFTFIGFFIFSNIPPDGPRGFYKKKAHHISGGPVRKDVLPHT